MFELAHRQQISERSDSHLPDAVRAFLIESDRRVIAHCHSLLKGSGLSAEERRRLMRLASEAEAELEHLAAQAGSSKNFGRRP
jgi:hypothetical protein